MIAFVLTVTVLFGAACTGAIYVVVGKDAARQDDLAAADRAAGRLLGERVWWM